MTVDEVYLISQTLRSSGTANNPNRANIAKPIINKDKPEQNLLFIAFPSSVDYSMPLKDVPTSWQIREIVKFFFCNRSLNNQTS